LKTPPLLIGPAVGKENMLAAAFAQYDALHYVAIRPYLASFAVVTRRIALQNACQKENERISTTPFLLGHFSPGDKIENCPAQFLAV
jgi:hypothetical protein